jgi:hypothetical protein
MWFTKGDRSKIISELMANFPAALEISNDEEIYSEEAGAEISNSQYLKFVRFNGDLWAINRSPNHGSLLGIQITPNSARQEREMRVLEFVEMPLADGSVSDAALDYGPCKRRSDYKAIGYAVHVLEDGTVLKTSEDWFRKKNPEIPDELFVR